MEFRPRDYITENESHALPRARADAHPLSSPLSHLTQVNDDLVGGNADFYDPLRGGIDNDAKSTPPDPVNFSETSGDQPIKEWTSFRRLLMQRFPVSKMVSLSSMPDVLMRSGKSHDKSATSMHLEELDDPKKFADEGVKVITWQEYVSRLHELKDEITRSWLADNRVTSLKLSIKVAKLMVDTSVSEFYPTLFVLVTDIMDMLGDLVWKRIKQKAEFTEDGALLCNLAENFEASDICADAKETCYNWFSKIGAVQDLLPRIYLELAILPCRRFLLDQPTDSLQRLVMMTRGLGDPVASAYCRLYMAHCAQKLPSHDIGYLVTCVNDLKVILTQTLATNERNLGNFQNNKKLQISLMEPTIEYIMKCIFIGLSQRRVNEVLSELGLMKNQQNFGTVSCVSLVLHHLLKELPIEVVSSNVVHILHLIEFNNDNSFHQHLNYRLLGFRLYEGKCPVDIVNAVLDKVLQVIAMYKSLDEYLKVIDAYADLILQNHMDNHLDIILRGISERALNGGVTIDEMSSLQSLLVKFLSHFECLEDVFCLNHFPEILDILHGKSQDVVFLHILNMATRSGRIRDPTRIQLLFEISRTLHDNMEFINAKNDDSQVTRSVSRTTLNQVMAKLSFIGVLMLMGFFTSEVRVTSTDWQQAHATFYDGPKGGACGYENQLINDYGKNTAALSEALFNDGRSCGGCYQIVCNASQDPQWCLKRTSVTVTATNFCPPNYSLPSDNGGWCNPPRPHFDMSRAAFETIAIYKAGIVPISYRKVGCKRDGGMRFTMNGVDYFELVVISNVGGAGDIWNVWIKGSKIENWESMSKSWGANWQSSRYLKGQSLSFRIQLSDGKTVIAKDVVPSDWRFGQTFSSNVQF